MKSKNILLITLFLVVTTFSFGQKFISRDGHIKFFSEAPLENIEANNHLVTSVFDLSTNEIAATMLIKSFEFSNSLMQEHFNENYLESDKFPKASFGGTLKSAQPIDATKNGSFPVTASGKLTIHGVTQPIEITGTLEVKDNTITIKAKFKVAIRDYKIDVPTLVIKNIAEVVEVTADFKYVPQKV